jgi:hypothetical protein
MHKEELLKESVNDESESLRDEFIFFDISEESDYMILKKKNIIIELKNKKGILI